MAGSCWPFTCSVHLAGSPGSLARESQQEGLESRNVSGPGQLGSFYAGEWRLASPPPYVSHSSSSVTRSHHVYLIEPASCLNGRELPALALCVKAGWLLLMTADSVLG